MNILLSRNAVRALFILLALSTSLNASAVTSFLNEWRNMYPESTSGDINCQLCHINAEGGEPWNAYGSALEQHYNRDGVDFSTRTIQESFTFVEALNSDQDSDPSTTNLEEINTNQQPGWREGQVNPNFLREGLALGLSFPPLTVDPFTQKIESQDVSLELVEIANGFTAPLGGVQAPVNSLRSQMFVTDQIGIVWRVDLNTGEKSEYLNVSHRLVELGLPNLGNYDERGLLGFAFHPEFTSNGRLYIYTSEPASSVADFTTLNSNQIADHQSVISELIVENPSQREGLATISSQRELMRLDQPQFNHNGGALVFDTQGLLYIGLGDGGNADDQGVGHSVDGNSSDLSNPYGSILRIDPLGNSHGAYGVPLDNPFVGNDQALDEIFAYGLRNPWKLSFDKQGNLYAADVGQNSIEEVNLITKGQHYGWRFREGRFFFDANGDENGILTVEFPNNLPFINLTPPILEYDHDEGISVIGGYIYQGALNPSLQGKYIFGDLLSSLFVGDVDNGTIVKMNLQPDILVFGFAQDTLGELYIIGNQTANVTGNTGKLIKLQSTLPVDEENKDLCFPIVSKNKHVSVACL